MKARAFSKAASLRLRFKAGTVRFSHSRGIGGQIYCERTLLAVFASYDSPTSPERGCPSSFTQLLQRALDCSTNRQSSNDFTSCRQRPRLYHYDCSFPTETFRINESKSPMNPLTSPLSLSSIKCLCYVPAEAHADLLSSLRTIIAQNCPYPRHSIMPTPAQYLG